jgi:alanine dehydrogenase
MIVGIPKEIKSDENRVAVTPAGVEILKQNGHSVLVEKTAGLASDFTDDEYVTAGAEIIDTAKDLFARADMILRVKEPQPSEYGLLREDQIYFSFLHLAAGHELAQCLMARKCACFGYETIQKADKSLPLLKPMSELAGAMAVQEGAKYLEMAQKGHGVLLGGVPGVDPGTVLIIGAGIVGSSAARVAAGLGASVYLLDSDLTRLRQLSDIMPFSKMCTNLYTA